MTVLAFYPNLSIFFQDVYIVMSLYNTAASGTSDVLNISIPN